MIAHRQKTEQQHQPDHPQSLYHARKEDECTTQGECDHLSDIPATLIDDVGQVRLGRWVPGLLHHLRTAGHLGSSAHPASVDGFFFLYRLFVCLHPTMCAL